MVVWTSPFCITHLLGALDRLWSIQPNEIHEPGYEQYSALKRVPPANAPIRDRFCIKSGQVCNRCAKVDIVQTPTPTKPSVDILIGIDWSL